MANKSSIRRVRLKDVALQAGVSPMAASLALNGKAGVGAKRVAEIRDVAERMGYQINDAARLLKSKRIRDIGLVLSETPKVMRQNAAFIDLVAGFMQECSRRRVDYRIEWIDQGKTDTQLPKIFNNGLAGSLLVAGWLHPMASDYIRTQLKLPCVRIGEPGPYSVENDYTEGLRRAVCHLVTRGHRRIGLINGPDFPVFRDALAGFRLGCEECALEFPDEYYREFDDRLVEYYDQSIPGYADWLIGLGDRRPTALVCSNGLFVKALVHELTRRGLRTPDDISIVVFMAMDWEAASYSPPLTSVEFGMLDLVTPALDLLDDLVERREIRKNNIKVMPVLTERSSVGRINSPAED